MGSLCWEFWSTDRTGDLGQGGIGLLRWDFWSTERTGYLGQGGVCLLRWFVWSIDRTGRCWHGDLFSLTCVWSTDRTGDLGLSGICSFLWVVWSICGGVWWWWSWVPVGGTHTLLPSHTQKLQDLLSGSGRVLFVQLRLDSMMEIFSLQLTLDFVDSATSHLPCLLCFPQLTDKAAQLPIT